MKRFAQDVMSWRNRQSLEILDTRKIRYRLGAEIVRTSITEISSQTIQISEKSGLKKERFGRRTIQRDIWKRKERVPESTRKCIQKLSVGFALIDALELSGMADSIQRKNGEICVISGTIGVSAVGEVNPWQKIISFHCRRADRMTSTIYNHFVYLVILGKKINSLTTETHL